MKMLRRRRRRGRLSPGQAAIDDNGRRLRHDASHLDGTCRWCHAAVHPPRRTFCNDSCVHEYLIRSNNQYMRKSIWERDRGVCAGCGVRTTTIGKAILTVADNAEQIHVRQTYSVPLKRKIWRSKFCSAVFDVDHIRPVATGGGQCGLQNLRTLCLACHKAVTWAACNTKVKSQRM